MKRLIILLMLATGIAAKAQTFKWPRNKKAVIILTYDDALISQLNTAVPQLQAAKLKATFFLSGDINRLTIPRWRQLSAQGYELGNHTFVHPCATTPDNPVPSETYTPYSIIREIDFMNHFLFAVDGKIKRTYAYPCTETSVNGKDYVDTLRKYALVKYARIGGDHNAIITDFKMLDPLRIPAYGLDGTNTAEQLIAYVKRVQQSGGMGIIMFHGIGGDYISTPAEAHQALVNYLKQNAATIWVPTFQQGLDYAFGGNLSIK